MAFAAPAPATVGTTVEISEIETLAKGVTIFGDGVGAPTTLAAGSDNLPLIMDSSQAVGARYGVLPIAGGGTAAATASGARTALAVAASGANSDITSLSALATPLSVVQGGTGGATTAAARTALSLDGVSLLLSTVSGVDLKVTGPTSLYTVPTGKTLYVTEIIVDITAASGFAVAATARIGKSAAYTEWLAATALTGLNGVGKFLQLSKTALGLVHQTFTANEVLAVDLTVGATATTLTGRFYVFGFLT